MAKKKPAMLIAIAIFKLLVALFLILVAIGVLQLLRKNIDDLLYRWFDNVGFDTTKDYMSSFLDRLLDLSRWKVKLISAATVVYSFLFFTEGFGLYFDQKWAELFTIIVTSGFIPFEIYELVVKANWSKILIIIINVGIIVYLIYRLRQKRFNNVIKETNIP